MDFKQGDLVWCLLARGECPGVVFEPYLPGTYMVEMPVHGATPVSADQMRAIGDDAAERERIETLYPGWNPKEAVAKWREYRAQRQRPEQRDYSG